jgi:hypothetical protein
MLFINFPTAGDCPVKPDNNKPFILKKSRLLSPAAGALSTKPRNTKRKTKTWNRILLYHFGKPGFKRNFLIFRRVLCVV